jgi:hypothetical protein
MKHKVMGMGKAEKGKITKPKVMGKGGLKIEGGFKAEGTKMDRKK